MKKIFCSVLFIILNLQAWSQLIVSGEVIDVQAGQALSDAHVILLQDDTKSTVTGKNGKFEIALPKTISKGDLLIQYLGYMEVLVPFDVKVQTNYKIEMEPFAAVLEQVQIVASKSVGEEFVVEEITKMDIYTNPNSRADPIRAVQSLPSSTSTEESANLSLRGSPAGETGFILNNVPIDDAFKLDQSNGVGQFSIFNTSIIKKIDVHPSNPPIEYGSASSGLVALSTDDFKGSNSQSVTLTMAGIGVNVSRKIGKSNSLVGYANIGTQKGLKWFNPNAFTAINSFNTFDAGLYWISHLKNNAKIKIFNYTLREKYSFNLTQPASQGAALQSKNRNLTILNYENRISNNLSFDINQGVNFTKAIYQYGNSEHFVKKNDFFTSFNLSHFTGRNSLKIGAAHDAHNFENNGQYPIYYWANATEHPYEMYETAMNLRNPEVYVYNKFRMSDRLFIGIGGRKNIFHSDKVESFWSHQVNLNYKPDDRNRFVLSFGQYHKLFLPGEQFVDPTLAISNHYSLDYSLDLEAFSLKTAFYKKHTTYPNRDLAVYGAEAFVSFTTNKVNTSLSAAHIQSEYISDGVTYPSEHDIGYFFRHLLKYKVISTIELNSSLLYRSGKYITPVIASIYHDATMTYQPIYTGVDEGSRLPIYTLWDIGLSHVSELGNGALLTFINCSNALDLKNVSGIAYNDQYKNIGKQYFSPRVVFFGFVYNWN